MSFFVLLMSSISFECRRADVDGFLSAEPFACRNISGCARTYNSMSKLMLICQCTIHDDRERRLEFLLLPRDLTVTVHVRSVLPSSVAAVVSPTNNH
jgi:hypothetical protein